MDGCGWLLTGVEETVRLRFNVCNPHATMCSLYAPSCGLEDRARAPNRWHIPNPGSNA